MGRPVTLALAAFIVVYTLQRLGELIVSRRNARALAARGGVLVPEPLYPAIVALHVAVPIALLVEVLVLGARPGPAWPLWLAGFVAAQWLRQSCIRALGVHWTVRVWVVPGAPRIRRGPYRSLRHPNYLAVAIELFAAPMIFGAWRTAAVASVLDLVLLWRRIRLEERALAVMPDPARSSAART